VSINYVDRNQRAGHWPLHYTAYETSKLTGSRTTSVRLAAISCRCYHPAALEYYVRQTMLTPIATAVTLGGFYRDAAAHA